MAGTGLTPGLSGRLASEDSLESNTLSVQVPLIGSQVSQAAAGPDLGEGTPGTTRRSGRQCFKTSIYQAGSGGMEGASSV